MEKGIDMADSFGWKTALYRWTAIGTALQVVMVVAGHWVAAIAGVFAILGTLISLVVGLLYAAAARVSFGNAALGGAAAGGVCAFVGILVSVVMGDVPGSVLLFGTLSGVVAGAVGGLIGHAVTGRTARATS